MQNHAELQGIHAESDNRCSYYVTNPHNSVWNRCAACGAETDTKFCGSACYHAWQRSRPIGDRFWSKVDKSGSCWLWTANKVGGNHSRIPYGQFTLAGPDGRRIAVYAHRYAWGLTHGPIPAGLQVLHVHCDNPLCIRPDHLALGTQADNLADASSKNRLNIPRPKNRKLTDEQVRQMFVMRAAGHTQREIARQFHVSTSFISLTLNGKRRVYTAPQLRQSQKESAA